MGKYDLAMKYATETGASTDFMATLRSMIGTSPDGALNFAKNLCNKNKSIPVHDIAELFASYNRMQEMTAFLVECMKDDRA